MLLCAGASAAPEATPTAYLCVNIAGHTAPVRALAFTPDSQRLCSAGLDKVVKIWRLPDRPMEAIAGPAKNVVREYWSLERTIHWEIGPCLRGSIYAMAIAPHNGLLAVGGYGARGMAGELLCVKSADGTYQSYHTEHRQSVMSVVFSSDDRWLASLDLSGEVFLRSFDGRRPLELCKPDAETYGAETARLIAGQTKTRFRPLTIAGNRSVMVPAFSGFGAQGVAEWRIQQYGIPGGRLQRTLPTVHYGAVHALASSADGRYMASADLAKRLYVWDLSQPNPEGQRLNQDRAVISLAFTSRGDVLAAGTNRPEGPAGSELQIWDVAHGQLLRKRPLSDDVYACAFSPDGKRLAYVGGVGHEIFVEWLQRPENVLRLNGGQPLAGLGFAGEGSTYTTAYQTASMQSRAAAKAFDPRALTIKAAAPPPAAAPASLGGWSAKLNREANGIWLAHGAAPPILLSLDRQQQGTLHTFCWIPAADGTPEAIALGSNVQCGIYLYSLPGATAPKLLRYLRGHYDIITALAVSADRKYLLSGSRDGTMRYWSLRGYRDGLTVAGRWGAEFAVRSGRLVVASIDDIGPLYNRGARAGDVLEKIAWGDPSGTRQYARPAEMFARLVEMPWDTQVVFWLTRNGAAQTPFQLIGAWHPLLTVYATENDDWIASTPTGYYACSSGGERLIGWHVNHGMGEKPSYFTAEQFNKALYRPDVIQSLLDKGSLQAALGQESPERSTVVEVLPPEVKILSPLRRSVEQQEAEIEIAAAGEARSEHAITGMWIELDGRPYDPLAPAPSAAQKRGGEAGTALAKAARPQARGLGLLHAAEKWRVRLAPGEHQIVVCAETDVSQGRSEPLRVKCLQKAIIKPTLYVLAVGISAYADDPATRQQLRLSYAHSDAAAVGKVLKLRGSPLFGAVVIRPITNDQATKSRILDGLDWLKKQLSGKASQKDVGVVFYAGHGISDPHNHFFLLPVDGALGRLAETCISAETIRRFCQEATPCRLVLFLDTCHSGAVGLAQSERTAKARDELGLQLARNDCGVVMIASSRGNQVSLESDEWGAGAFTKALVEGLDGGACFANQKVVSVPLLYFYVRQAVMELTKGRQDPTINFDNPYTTDILFPLTSKAEPPATPLANSP
jgi:WD40 repeat protein